MRFPFVGSTDGPPCWLHPVHVGAPYRGVCVWLCVCVMGRVGCTAAGASLAELATALDQDQVRQQ
jgi:hypothetical protein